MKKNSKKQSYTPKVSTLTVLSLVIAAVSLVLSAYSYSLTQYNLDLISGNQSKLWHRDSRLRVCYDNNIHPCTDGEIEKWNADNPEDQFRLLPPQ